MDDGDDLAKKLHQLFFNVMGWEDLKKTFGKNDEEMQRQANIWCKNAGLPLPYPSVGT
jgi:hypothetical protein